MEGKKKQMVGMNSLQLWNGNERERENRLAERERELVRRESD